MGLAAVQQWEIVDVLAMLSLDLTASYFVDLGLGGIDRERFQATLRNCVRENSLLLERKLNHTDETKAIHKVLGTIGLRLQDSEASTFSAWMEDVLPLHPSYSADWYAYQSFFVRLWSQRMRDSGIDSGSVFLDKYLIYFAFERYIPQEQVDEQIARSRKQRLSGWDAEIFRISKFTLQEEVVDDVEEYDILLTIKLMISGDISFKPSGIT